MSILGPPTDDDMCFITDKSAIAYIKEFAARGGVTSLGDRYPYASEAALDLLRKMVSFNPFLRPTIEECLEHPFFEKIRKPVFEVQAE